MMIDKSRINTHSYENNEPQRRRERKEKKNLCQWFGYTHHKPVSSVDKFSFLLVRRRPMGNSWVMIGLLLFLLALGGTRIIAAASPLSAPSIIILAGIILMLVTFYLSQNLTRPHLTQTGVGEMPCPACNGNHKPGVLFCQVCGRELNTGPIMNAITTTPQPSHWRELSLRSPVVVILLLLLSLILSWI